MKYLIVLIFIFCACNQNLKNQAFSEKSVNSKPQHNAQKYSKAQTSIVVNDIIVSARKQIGVTTSYDPQYFSLKYPGGDVPENTGVCTDVIIRALRDSRQMDLQKLVHEDMKRNFSKYPDIWGLSRPDKNIDHRRVPNLQRFFERHSYDIESNFKTSEFLPGDLVTCMVGNRPHIMIISNRKLDGIPLVIHNIGSGTVEDNSLLKYKITGHYRIE